MRSRSKRALPDPGMSQAEPQARKILVAGATGALGSRIAARIAASGAKVVAAYRTERPEAIAALKQAGCVTAPLDLADVDKAAAMIADVDVAVLPPILTVSGPAARAALAKGVRTRLVLFSSNNVTIDLVSPIYRALRDEEAAVAAAGGDAFVVRPTMIYGHARDGNLSRLMRMAQKWPALPLIGSGQALQQPIHVDDLASLAVHLADGAGDGPRLIAAGGPDAVTLHRLYLDVAGAAGRKTPVIKIWRRPLLAMAWRAEAARLPFPLEYAQLFRSESDKTPVGPVPSGWRPEIRLADGLARLARELAAGSA